MIPTPLPEFPWQQVGVDLFEMAGQHYLLVVDYSPDSLKLLSLYQPLPQVSL